MGGWIALRNGIISIETNIEDTNLDTVKKLFLLTGEHHISPGDYVDIDNSADTTLIDQSENLSEHIVKEFLTNKEKEKKEEDNDEEKNITTNEILFDNEHNFKQNLLIMENFILHTESGFIYEFLKFKSKYEEYHFNVKTLKQSTSDSYFKW